MCYLDSCTSRASSDLPIRLVLARVGVVGYAKAGGFYPVFDDNYASFVACVAAAGSVEAVDFDSTLNAAIEASYDDAGYNFLVSSVPPAFYWPNTG